MTDPDPLEELRPWVRHGNGCYPCGIDGCFYHPCSCGLDDALASLAATPEGLSDDCKNTRRLTKEPK